MYTYIYIYVYIYIYIYTYIHIYTKTSPGALGSTSERRGALDLFCPKLPQGRPAQCPKAPQDPGPVSQRPQSDEARPRN